MSVLLFTPFQQPSGNGANPSMAAAKQTVLDALRSYGGYFIENRGQVDEAIRYYSTGNPSVAFRDDGVMFVLREERAEPMRSRPDSVQFTSETMSVTSLAYLVHFDAANEVVPAGRELLQFGSNFFIGNDPSLWRTNVPGYREVIYRNLYEGIDLVYRSTSSGVKYEFILRAGADPNIIKMTFDGVESLYVDQEGAVIVTPLGVMRDLSPYTFQGDGAVVSCGFITRAQSTLGFSCGHYDPTEELTIDPLVYSTYLGGSGSDFGLAVDVDSFGNAIVAGWAWSLDFPTTPGTFMEINSGMGDAYVTELNGNGSSLLFSTFLGGSFSDGANGVFVDPSGDIYVTGETSSANFPVTAGAFDQFANGYVDVFVAKLNASGDALLYSTYLGGAVGEWGESIAVDSAGDAYVTGFSTSLNFPTTPGAYSTANYGGSDIFVTKLDQAGGSLVYSTYLGGSGYEGYTGSLVENTIVIDSFGNAYVTGFTNSTDFPVTPGAFDITANGNRDGFITRLNVSGGGLDYSTYIGGSDWDYAESVAVDVEGYAYVTGHTYSPEFPVTSRAYDTTLDSGEAFVLKLGRTGDSLVYSTFLGGTSDEDGESIAVDMEGNAYVVGTTYSRDFPVTGGAVQKSCPGLCTDVFLTKLNAAGSGLRYSTYLGGSEWDWGYAIAVDSSGDAYVVGHIESSDFPVSAGAFQTVMKGSSSAFVAKLSPITPDLTVLPSDIVFNPPSPAVAGSIVAINVTIHNIGDMNTSQVSVRFHDGPPSGSNRIGADQVVPSIHRLGGTGSASIYWQVDAIGTHNICVFADPDNAIVEENESNNMACAPFEVLSLPDYMPVNTQPASPVTVGLSIRIELSLEVLNAGGSAPSSATTIVFFNGTTPSSPFFVCVFQPIPARATIGPCAMNWTSPANPGKYFVTAHVDLLNYVNESNEANNIFTWTIYAVSGPVTSLVIGDPNYTEAVTYVKSSTPLGFSIEDRSGVGIRNTTYRIDDGSWANYTATGQFDLTGKADGQHQIAWYSVDYAGNVEKVRNTILYVDDTPPLTSISPAIEPFTTATFFALGATDALSGVAYTEYRIDGGNWTRYNAPFSLSEGVHTIGYRSTDNLGNMELERTLEVHVGADQSTTTITALIWLIVFAAIAVAAVLIMVFALWRRRKQEEDESPPPASPSSGTEQPPKK